MNLQDTNPQIYQHVLSVSPEGNISKDSIKVLNTLSDTNSITNNQSQIENIMEGLRRYAASRQDQPKKIVFFIHGGLVTEESLITRVQAVLPQIMPDAYPIFVNWRSGPFETYGYQLFKIRNGEHSRFAKFNWPIFLLTDIANIFIHGPKSWVISSTHSIRGKYLRTLKKTTESLASYDRAYKQVIFTGNGETKSSLGGSLSWWIKGIVKLISVPFAHALGKPAWDEMLRRADNVVYPTDSRPIDSNADEQNKFELSALALLINEISKSELNTIPKDIIGHSMGAIITNRLLRQQDEIKFKNIVHMASADTVDALFSSVFPYLENNKDSNFYSLHLHPRNEEREINMLGFAPTGSLLVYIEDMFTTPDSVLSRRSGAWDNIARIFDRLPDTTDIVQRMNFTVFGMDKTALEKNEANPDERISHPQKHGDFSRTRFWQENTWMGHIDDES